MTNLICSVNTCSNNENNLCCRESIRVGGKDTIIANFTSCESYRRKSGELTNSAHTPNNSLNITCEAENCVYNNCKMCEAEMVNVAGLNALSDIQTECATFISKIDK